MKKSYLKILIINILAILVLITNLFTQYFNGYYFLIVFTLLILGLLIFNVGYEKDRMRFRKDLSFSVVMYSIFYVLITYVFGLYTGFVRNGNLFSIIPDLLPYFIFIITTEVTRYNIIKKGNRNLLIYGIQILLFILIELNLYRNNYDFSNADSIIKLVTTFLIPITSENIMLTYLTYKAGYLPSISYRMIFELKNFILPLFPDFGLYLTAIVDFLFPVFIVYRVNYLFKAFEKEKILTRVKKSTIITILINSFSLILFVSIITLTSGLFKYYAVTIGSESMTPNIHKGDIVILEKLNKKEMQNLKIGDILVFKSESKMIVHRIVRIIKIKDEIYFYTKGDFNESEDGFPSDTANVIGKALTRIRYIGYPSVYLNEILH